MGKLKEFIKESKRVFRITKKPTKEEYKNIALVSAIGILVIGLIGYILKITEVYTSTSFAVLIAIIAILILMYYKKSN